MIDRLNLSSLKHITMSTFPASMSAFSRVIAGRFMLPPE